MIDEKGEIIMITIVDFIKDFQEKKIIDTQIAPNAVAEYIKKTLEVKTYIPFSTKKQIAEMIVEQNSSVENGIVYIDSVGQFIGFIMAMLAAHTNLQINTEDPISDYDALSESGLLEVIIAQFEKSYSESEVILKMVASDALAGNNLNAVVARFLDGILDKLDGVGDGLKSMIEGIDLKSILGANFTEKDLSQLKGFLDRYNN
jgi:hypothetical protein